MEVGQSCDYNNDKGNNSINDKDAVVKDYDNDNDSIKNDDDDDDDDDKDK